LPTRSVMVPRNWPLPPARWLWPRAVAEGKG
jgi:hypothetical protein